jgi:hypothetical protein
MHARRKEARGEVFPRITNGKVYVPIGGELKDGTMIDGLVELPPEDPSYDAIKALLIQVELGEWALKGILPRLATSTRDRASSIHLELLGYEARGEGWDDILDCFAAERERRYGVHPLD